MDAGYTSSGPVELPRAYVELQLGRRRHRRITGTAGLLLFLCMFLPAVRGCEAPVYPIEMPIVLPPYLFGLVFALAATAMTARTLRYAIVGLRVTAIATVLGSLVVTVISPQIGLTEMFSGVVVLAALGWSGGSERRAAAAAIVVGVIGTLWFGFWVAVPDAMVGVYVSALGALGLLVGGLVWLGDARPGGMMQVHEVDARSRRARGAR